MTAMKELVSGMFGRRKLRRAVLLLGLAVVAGAVLYALAVADSEAEASRMAEILALKPGMTVAEIGAGEGRMTVSIARRLGSTGRMFSTELNPARVHDIQEAVAKAGLACLSPFHRSRGHGCEPFPEPPAGGLAGGGRLCASRVALLAAPAGWDPGQPGRSWRAAEDSR
ncbi:MAG: hypothetical protein HY236_09655 [Acidobacteria bacterium]|nr:hypothetical protein [Acidobacteriota bacterium]